MPAARDNRSPGRLIAFGMAALVLAALAGCDRMAKQAKDKPYESRGKPGAAVAVAPVPGTVAREAIDDSVPALDLALLQRGRERFDIYCAPCHGRTGDGDGMIVRRGFPAPPSYHSDRLRAASEQHLYEVIGQGYGAMFAYGPRIAPRDRWAIVAYIRALQLSQHSDVASLDAARREALP
jgi:mono/diheme cytochrome c family protein